MSAEKELAAALRARLALIADAESRRDQEQHLGKLQAISEKIVALQGQLPRPIDPQLAHYLTKCSYDKVLDFLETKAERANSRAAEDVGERVPPPA